MKYKCKIPMVLVIVLWLTCLASPGLASSPMSLVKHVLNKVIDIQRDPKIQGPQYHSKRAMEIKRIITENFDSKGMAKQSLETYWNKISVKNRNKFSAIFADLFQDSYTRLVLNFLKQQTIKYLGDTEDGEKAIVKTSIIKANDEIRVTYYLHYTNKRWIIDDVTIDGVSIVGNYRSMFRHEIAVNSFQTLLKKMEIQQKVIQAKVK